MEETGSDPDFSPNNEMKSFEHLSLQYGLPKSHLFRFFHVRSYIFDVVKKKSIQEINSLIKCMLKIYDCGTETKLLTKLVKIIQANYQDKQMDLNVKNKWENEIPCNISPVEWGQMCKNIHETTNSNYWKEFAWKIINRYFRTPQIQSKYKSNVTSSCWRKCGEQKAHHSHVFWPGKVLGGFWKTLFNLCYFDSSLTNCLMDLVN